MTYDQDGDERFCWNEAWRFERGLAPFYPLLRTLVLGLEARRVFECGTGASTRVLLDALECTRGTLVSCSTEPSEQVFGGFLAGHSRWKHFRGTSDECLTLVLAGHPGPYDLVLHDGSHGALVVERDLRLILPHVLQFGLVLVHDTQHSEYGKPMRQALRTALDEFPLTAVTLPFAYGLTILRMEGNLALGSVQVTRTKPTSAHWTEPCTL